SYPSHPTALVYIFNSLLFFTATPTTEIYTLSLHDALPIYCDGRAGLRASIPVEDLDAYIVKEFESLRLGESAANEKRSQFAAKGLVNTLQQHSAQPRLRTPASRYAIYPNQRV